MGGRKKEGREGERVGGERGRNGKEGERGGKREKREGGRREGEEEKDPFLNHKRRLLTYCMAAWSCSLSNT